MPDLAAIALPLMLAPALAVLLRRAGCPGAAVIGGLIAGVLLGPTILGRVLPTTYEATFQGGRAERIALRELHSRHGADRLAALHASPDEPFDGTMLSRQRNEIAHAEAQYAAARWEHQTPQRMFAIGLIVLALLGSGCAGTPRPNGHRGMSAPVMIGLWTAVVPGSLVAVVATLWWSLQPGETAVLAAAVMIGPWALTRVDRQIVEDAEPGAALLVQYAGRAASVIAIAVLGWGAWQLRGAAGLLWTLPLLALVAGWMIPHRVHASRVTRASAALIQAVAIPTLAATAILRVDAILHFAIWPILIVLLLSGDGRWLGSLLGMLVLGGRTGSQAMRVALGAMASGPTQLAVAALAAHIWLLDETLVYAVIAGVAYVELSVPLRRWMATVIQRE